jgi:hypothetical protein
MRALRKALLYLAIVLVPLGIAYAFLADFGVISETKAKLSNLSGADFEVTYTNSDRLAKEEYVSVYISRTALNRTSAFDRWRNKRTLLFRYDPGRWDAPLPSISNSGPNKILIAVPRVSSITRQSKSWENLSVDYEIGYVDYP